MLTTKVIKFFQFHHRFVPFKLFTFNPHSVKRRCKSPFRYDCRNYRQPYWCWRFFSLHE